MAETTIQISTPADYRALHNGSALQIRRESGVLQLGDSDRQDFLHRMTTNEINKLRPGRSTVTILTSPTARTLFAFTVVIRDDDLLLLAAPNETDALARHLRGQIFFMDAVTLTNVSAAWTRMRLMGNQAGNVLAVVGINLDGAADGAWNERDGLYAVKQERYDVPGYELVVPAERTDDLLSSLVDAGVVLVEDETYNVRRVELGRPMAGAELVEAYSPLEAGMGWVCAEDKGCYTGQEIIARQITYDKVTKTLVGLRGQEPMILGAEVMADGRSVGNVTSVAYSPAIDAHLALAVLKRPANQPGVRVVVDGQSATVTPLPFTEQ